MKPAPFEFVAPESCEAVLSLLRQHGGDAKLLAGGQSLIPLLNFRLARPRLLVDLNRLTELDYIRSGPNGGLRIGALTRQSRLESEPLVRERAPLLAEALPFVAHPQIRNRGTIGGTMAHADPAAELPAVAIALDARFRLQSDSAERWIDSRDFFLGLLQTALEPEELLVEVEIPPQPASRGWSFLEIARRLGDYALAGIATWISTDGEGTCTDARLVYLSAGDTPVTAPRAADILRHQKLDDDLFEAAADMAATSEIEPTGDIHASGAFKRHLCRVLTRRALRRAAERAGSGRRD